MTPEAEALLRRARQALQSAEVLTSTGDAVGAVNRAYYAAFYAASAALRTVGESPRTHSGTQRRFYLHFVESGQLPVSTSETLRHAFDLRQRADYDAFSTFDVQAASDLIADVDAFVQRVRSLLEKGF